MPDPERGYRWGKFQAWSSLVVGVCLLLAAAFFDVGSGKTLAFAFFLTGSLHVWLWRGLLRKKRYGFVLYYVLIALIVHSILWLKPHPEVYVFTLWWLVPGIFYYPKRRREFGFGREKPKATGVQPTEPAATPEQVVAQSPEVVERDGIRRVGYEEWREAIARYRVEKMRERQ